MGWIFTHLRTVSLILLLIGMFLPFSSCTVPITADAEHNWSDTTEQYTDKTNVVKFYLWENFKTPDAESIWFAVVLLWPVLASYYFYRGQRHGLQIVRRIAEPILSLISLVFFLVLANILTTPMIGAYVVTSAYLLYLVAWILEMRQLRHGSKASL